jgi:hypothetical protein
MCERSGTRLLLFLVNRALGQRKWKRTGRGSHAGLPRERGARTWGDRRAKRGEWAHLSTEQTILQVSRARFPRVPNE